MNGQQILNKAWLVTAAMLGTVLVASCAMNSPPPAPSGSGSSGGVASDENAGLEEIVVAGTRTQPSPQAGRMNRRSPDQPVLRMVMSATPEQVLEHVSSDEELWVISTPARQDPAAANEDDSPGSGAMVVNLPVGDDQTTEVPLPLKHTDVSAAIDGYVSSVDVRQTFENPFNEKIEAVYLFPLPEKAAVSEFLMIIGERHIRGILREKEEAEAIYQHARSQGYQVSQLTQHRPNVFEQKVANIEPGKAIDVNIRYFNTLAYDDGWYTFVFPTVVGPRYNPPEHKDPITPVPRSSIQPTSQGVTAQYLRPDERSAHDLSIRVDVDAGVTIEELQSSHEIVASRATPETASVQLANKAMIPNRDFTLRFKVAGDTMKSNLLTYVDPETQQGYFTLMVYPPAVVGSLARQPMEMVFVLDCSGSMNGRPLEQAKAAVSTALDHLQEGDTFQIIRFSDNSSSFGATPVPATVQNLQKARRYLQKLNGTGGTEMIEGVKAALDFPHDPARLRFVSFMTDGYIGNEADIIAAVHERIGSSRIFSFGVGSSVNRYLLERMAKEGRGAVAWLGPQDSADDIMDGFFNRISHPAMTDVRFEWGGMAVTDVYPATFPDLFVGRPVVVTGKYLGAANGISVSGKSGNGSLRFDIAAESPVDSRAYLPKIWARLRIADLSDRQAWSSDPYNELGNAIKATALEYQLMSDYTSFVAVDSSYRTEGEHGTTVHQVLPVPDGVRYDTTVNPN